MALSVRRSILMHSLIVGFAFFLVSPPASAQRPVRVVTPPPPPVMHTPIYRAPIYQPPVYRAPIYRTPTYGPTFAQPRVSSVTPVRSPSIIPFRPPRRPIRPLPPAFLVYPLSIFNSPFWPADFCWRATCGQVWTYPLAYSGAPLAVWNPVDYAFPPASEPAFYGQEGQDIPQLFLKNDSVLNVTDYWLIDGQLHFMMVQEEGTKPSEQVIPFEDLDLQKTVDVNTRRGFHFMLRNEPFAQYVRDHSDGPPPSSPQ